MRVVVVMLALLAFGALGASSCGVAPVVYGAPSEAPRTLYRGAHGRPLAFGGGVCAASGAHAHRYPPAPSAAFVQEPDGHLRDTRPMVPFVDPHRHGGRTCFIERWHLHIVDGRPESDPKNDETLVFDEGLRAWRARQG